MTHAAPSNADRRPGRAGLDRTSGAEDAVLRALGQFVDAIGDATFPTVLLDTLRALAGVELCSVFARDKGQRIELLFAQGELTSRPGFALQASQTYVRAHWQSDRQLAQFGGSPAGVPVVIRRRARDIADPAYRTACYDQAGVIDRLSILSPGRPCFVINGYRTAQLAPFDAADMSQLERYAPVLLAGLRQHLRMSLASKQPIDHATVIGTLASLERGLSMREVEVVAGLMLGHTQTRIAAETSLSVATIVTYRRRAYDKLGVANRSDLAALRDRLLNDTGNRIFASH